MIQYSFNLKIENKEFGIAGDKEFVEHHVNKWLALFGTDLPPELRPDNFEAVKQPPMLDQIQTKLPKQTILEFMKSKAPKSVADHIVSVSYYIERYMGQTYFVLKDIMEVWFDKIAEKLNITEADIKEGLAKLIEQSYLQQNDLADGSQKYNLTFSGEQYVKSGFEE